MKRINLRMIALAGVFFVSTATIMSCSKKDNDPPVVTPTPNNPSNPSNPTPKFDAPKNLTISILKTDYTPGDDEIYIDYHVKNKNSTQSYDINDDVWDIEFKIKATDGYEFKNHVNLLSIEADSDFEHGLPIYVSTGKTLDLSTLTFQVVPSID